MSIINKPWLWIFLYLVWIQAPDPGEGKIYLSNNIHSYDIDYEAEDSAREELLFDDQQSHIPINKQELLSDKGYKPKIPNNRVELLNEERHQFDIPTNMKGLLFEPFNRDIPINREKFYNDEPYHSDIRNNKKESLTENRHQIDIPNDRKELHYKLVHSNIPNNRRELLTEVRYQPEISKKKKELLTEDHHQLEIPNNRKELLFKPIHPDTPKNREGLLTAVHQQTDTSTSSDDLLFDERHQSNIPANGKELFPDERHKLDFSFKREELLFDKRHPSKILTNKVSPVEYNSQETDFIYLCIHNKDRHKLVDCCDESSGVIACIGLKGLIECTIDPEDGELVPMCAETKSRKLVDCNNISSDSLCFPEENKTSPIKLCKDKRRHVCLTDDGHLEPCHKPLMLSFDTEKKGFVFPHTATWNSWWEKWIENVTGVKSNLMSITYLGDKPVLLNITDEHAIISVDQTTDKQELLNASEDTAILRYSLEDKSNLFYRSEDPFNLFQNSPFMEKLIMLNTPEVRAMSSPNLDSKNASKNVRNFIISEKSKPALLNTSEARLFSADDKYVSFDETQDTFVLLPSVTEKSSFLLNTSEDVVLPSGLPKYKSFLSNLSEEVSNFMKSIIDESLILNDSAVPSKSGNATALHCSPECVSNLTLVFLGALEDVYNFTSEFEGAFGFGSSSTPEIEQYNSTADENYQPATTEKEHIIGTERDIFYKPYKDREEWKLFWNEWVLNAKHEKGNIIKDFKELCIPRGQYAELINCTNKATSTSACISAIDGKLYKCKSSRKSEMLIPLCVVEYSNLLITCGQFTYAFLCTPNGNNITRPCTFEERYLSITEEGKIANSSDSVFSKKIKPTRQPSIVENFRFKKMEEENRNQEVGKRDKTYRINADENKELENDHGTKANRSPVRSWKRNARRDVVKHEALTRGLEEAKGNKRKLSVSRNIWEQRKEQSKVVKRSDRTPKKENTKIHFEVYGKDKNPGLTTRLQVKIIEEYADNNDNLEYKEYKRKQREDMKRKATELIATIHKFKKHLCVQNSESGKFISCDNDGDLQFVCFGARSGSLKKCIKFRESDPVFPVCTEVGTNRLVTCNIVSNVKLCFDASSESRLVPCGQDATRNVCLSPIGTLSECSRKERVLTASNLSAVVKRSTDEKFYHLKCKDCEIDNKMVVVGTPKAVLPEVEIIDFAKGEKKEEKVMKREKENKKENKKKNEKKNI